MRKTKSKVSNIANLTVEQFNHFYPVGTKVKYYPISSRKENCKDAQTTSIAYEMCGSKMVGLNISGGGYCFDNIEVNNAG